MLEKKLLRGLCKQVHIKEAGQFLPRGRCEGTGFYLCSVLLRSLSDFFYYILKVCLITRVIGNNRIFENIKYICELV